MYNLPVRDDKTLEDVLSVIKLNRPIEVIKLHWVKYQNGLAFKKFISSLEEEYKTLYPEGNLYIIYDEVTTETKQTDPTSKPEVIITPIIKSKYLDNEGNIKDEYKDVEVIPSLEYFIQSKYNDLENGYKDPEYSENEFKKFFKPYIRKILNEQREQELNNLTIVTSTGKNLDADETSQTRISKAILSGVPELAWTGANDEEYTLTQDEFKEALLLAGQKQSEIWAKYRALKAEWNPEEDE